MSEAVNRERSAGGCHHDVAAALAGVEQKRHRQSGARSDRVPRFVLLDLGLGPRMDAAGFCFGWLESGGGVAAH